MITFQCECGQQLRAGDENAGKATVCPGCKKRLTIPSLPSSPQPAPPPFVSDTEELTEAPAAPRRRRTPEPADDEEPPRRRRGADFDDDGQASAKPATSGKALTSLILGLLSFCLPVLLSLPAILLGILGLMSISKSQGRLGGKGLALVGIITGALSLIGGGIVAITAILVIPNVRDAAVRTQTLNQIKMMGLAMHSHNDAMRSLPPQATYDKTGRPLLSWRVYLLPYMEEQQLFTQFKLDEPWDGPHNSKLLTRMPKMYTHPSQDAETVKKGLTHFQVFIGPPGTMPEPALGNDNGPLQLFGPGGPNVFRKSHGVIPQDFTDGTSNTLSVVVATNPVPWTKPEDIPYSPQQPLPRLGLPGPTFQAGRMDGSARTIDPRRTSEQTIRAAITRNGNEVLGPDWD